MKCRLLTWKLTEVNNTGPPHFHENQRCNPMSRFSQIAVTTLFLLFAVFMPFAAQSKVDWDVSQAIQLDETPLDVALAQERQLTFLLTDGARVYIYSSEKKLIGTIPVDPAVTDITVSASGDQLYLINSKRKTLQTVDVSFIVDINVDDSPFLGPAEAKVVVAVFSDFQ
jgi:hypothetical protein